ncbi:hypothetical protein HYZ97_01785 [Candidatus Pacearchaeota archaeon]|nr:hypothetical protein [Candidatus Pacearchaeota archaeon]
MIINAMDKKIKPKMGVHHLASWYFGNFCAMKYGHGKDCDDKLQGIANELEKIGIKEMTHKEFCIIARENLTCKPIKRKFNDCPICKVMKIKHRH